MKPMSAVVRNVRDEVLVDFLLQVGALTIGEATRVVTAGMTFGETRPHVTVTLVYDLDDALQANELFDHAVE